MRIVILLLFAAVAYGQQATCWPVPSNLKKYNSYFCAIDAPPGAVVTGRQLMASLAELEPLPDSLAVQAGGDQNRLSPQNLTHLTEQYILPGISAATALEGIKIAETPLRTLVVLSPVIFGIIKGLVVGTAPDEWARPAALVIDGEIPLDSRGSASAAVYTRRDGGVRRVSLPGAAPAPPAPASAPQLPPGFVPSTITGADDEPCPGPYQDYPPCICSATDPQVCVDICSQMPYAPPKHCLSFVPASWYALRQQAQLAATIATWRAVDESWRLEERIAEAEGRMNFHEVELLAGR